jgi:glycosyltransferase involved in cell wall biosynthesis
MSSNQQPLVSVVTPLYNGEAYLRECIESVLAQTYTNWDYTIVNNCSTDRSLEIAQEYATRDPRIRVRSNDAFVGVIQNYNNAFRQASPESKYCKAVAADDWLFPDCLEKMVLLAEHHPSVAIVGAYQLQDTRVTSDGLAYPSTIVQGRDVCRSLLLGGPYVFGSPTTVLFRSDIVRSRYAFYNESNLHADGEACLEFLQHHDFGFVHQVLTFTRLREESLTSYSISFQTYLPYKLYELVTYGPKYLSDAELTERIRSRLDTYYHYLASQIHERRGQDFWKFHREKLAELGYPLSWTRLTVAAARFVLTTVLNLPKMMEIVARRIRGIRSGGLQ